MTRPNILLFLSDQHNPHILGCAGDRVVRTPHLDALAAQGIYFRHTYSGSPLCVPSRMSFLTSQYPSDIGVWTNRCTLASDVPTFAHALSLAGYETVLCGRMHFNGADQHHGFEQRLVGDVSGAMVDSGDLFEGQIPVVTTGQSAPGVKVAGPGRSTYIAYDDDVTQRACGFLQERARLQPERPFCLVVGYLLPHSPYICPRHLFTEYMETIEMPAVSADAMRALHPAMRRWRQNRAVESITMAEARRARAAYYGLVTYLDRCIGDVLNTLHTTGFGADTAVIYLSDHGDMAGEHGMWWKSSFYEGSVSVPMIWSWPARFAQGVTVDEVTSLLDVGPTLLDLAACTPLRHSRGHSLRPFLQAERPQNWPQAAMAELYTEQEPPSRMIRAGRWKLNHYHGYDTSQLFDLESDPTEQLDLGSDGNYAGIRETLLARVCMGWSAERIEESVAQRKAGQELVRRWQQTVALGKSERWVMPAGCNQFPDPLSEHTEQ